MSQESCLHCGAVCEPGASVCPRCHQPLIEPDEPPEAWLGRTLDNKYEIQSILGVGGMGMVFSARRVLVGDEVALKVLYPRLLQSPLQRDLFRDEAIAAARLSHRNVVTVYDAGFAEEENVAYIAMELLRGRTLKDLLRERAPLSPGEFVPLATQICEGLAAAHSAQIIHRDLKPDNVFLEEMAGGGIRVKLVDFGISAMLDMDRSGERRQRLGTLRYMSPEQCRGQTVDRRADLYALGVVLYEGLTRRRVTGKSVSAVVSEVPAIPNLLLPAEQQLPPRLEDLLLRLLAKNPDDRPSTAEETQAALAASLDGGPAADRPVHMVVDGSSISSESSVTFSWKYAILVGIIFGLIFGVL